MLVVCLVLSFGSLAINGSILSLYGLHRDRSEITRQISNLKSEIIAQDEKLKQARDPVYIERQALDHLDLVSENDLVFVFAE